MIVKEICHVCKKEKKPYSVILTDSIMSILDYKQAREKGPICKRCDSYFAMTGEFKDSTEKEFEIAKKSAWFAHIMLKWWEIDGKISEENSSRDWSGTYSVAKWCRRELSKRGYNE